MTDAELGETLHRITGHRPRDPALFVQALTHGSSARNDYQRLEFLGDRVLGLSIAAELYARFPQESEGALSARFNALVSGDRCAEVARRIALPALIRLGRQARDDGGRFSDNIASDVMEALIGALYLDAGPDAARDFVLSHWSPLIDTQTSAPKHPKSALQEWAAANNRRPPDYEIIARDGPPHAPRFKVAVRIGKLAEAEAEGASKHAAETLAATKLLAALTGQQT